MKKKHHRDAAFALGPDDRFRCIICSHPVHFDDKQKAEVILTFFVIRRAGNTYTICNVNRTYDAKGKCQSRSVQVKDGISGDRIEQEVEAIRDAFSKGIQVGSGRKLKWDDLDLSDVTSMQEQVRLIQEWGRVGVSLSADFPEISLN